MRQLVITTGKTRLTPRIKMGRVSWEKLAKRLGKFTKVPHTYKDFLSYNLEKQSSIKDIGYLIGGRFSANVRDRTGLIGRDIITLDVDHLPSWEIDALQDVYGDLEFVVHSTIKHDPEGVCRLRLVFPLSRMAKPDEYEPLSRKLAERLGLDIFDDTTFQSSRIMFWPSVASDMEPYFLHNTGDWLDVDGVLAEYDDWTDFAEWPCSSRVGQISHSNEGAVENPLLKDGIIGAFCRTYDIHAAIQAFDLPYETTSSDCRYRPIGATGPAGAVVYDEGLFMFSNHESDPCGLQNVNAWDMVRIHKFGDYTKEELELPVMLRESNKNMSAYALGMKNVVANLELASDDEMDDETKTDDAPRNGDGHEQEIVNHDAPATGKLDFETLSNEIAALDASSSYRDCADLIPRIAAAKLDPVENGTLATMLRNHWPSPAPTKKDITDQIGLAHKRLTAKLSTSGEILDIEESLIEEVLQEHWKSGEHLILKGRLFWDYYKGVWMPQEDDRVAGHVQTTLKRLRKERPEDVMDLVAAVGDSKTSALTSQLFNMMRGHVARTTPRIDPLGLMRRFMPPVVNCLNGEVWFAHDGTYEFHKHDSRNFFTTQIAVEYDADAKCPLWDEFMRVIWQDCLDPEDMIRHLEEIGGYCLQMSRWIKTWILFNGPKDAGKSTVSETIGAMLGNSVVTKAMASYDGKNSHAEAGLTGKLLMVDDDFGRNDRLPDGFIKKISEEKIMTANPKGKDEYQFVARIVPLICSNYWPSTSDISDAFVERAQVLHFNHRLTGSERDDRKKAAMLTEELPGIMNRFLAGFSRLRARGDWAVPADSKIAHKTWVRNSNPTQLFVVENVVHSKGDEIRRSDLYQLYTSWCKAGAFRPLGRQHFNEAMVRIIGTPTKRNGHMVYLDSKLGDGEFTGDIENEMDEF